MNQIETAYFIIRNHLPLEHRPYYLAFLLGVAVILNLVRIKKRLTWRETALIAFLIIYMAFVAAITLIERTPDVELKMKLVPLWSWHKMIITHSRRAFDEIVLNILMLFPVGGVLQLWKKIGSRKALLYGLEISLIIETLQLLSYRGYFEWDDLLHNSVGCMLGAVVIERVQRWFRRF